MPPVELRVSAQAKELTLSGDRRAVVGRARDADVVINHPRVSRQHVALEPSSTGWVARDLSTNGMWHEGQRVATLPLGAGTTRLRLGGADGPELTLTALVPPAAPAPAPLAEPALDELETRLAPNTGEFTPRAPRPAAQAPAPASWPGQGTGPSYSPAPAHAGMAPAAWQPAQQVPAPRQPAPAAARTPAWWVKAAPTWVWLFAAAFAIGALVALS